MTALVAAVDTEHMNLTIANAKAETEELRKLQERHHSLRRSVLSGGILSANDSKLMMEEQGSYYNNIQIFLHSLCRKRDG